MFSKLVITAINIYQVIFSDFLKNLLGVNKFCRFPETCSMYTKRMIKENGLGKGLGFGMIRLIKCQPFYPLPFQLDKQTKSSSLIRKVLG